MKTKLVLWGTNVQEERVLIAMQLRADDNKVDIWTFPEAIASPEFAQSMLNDWRNDATEVTFPDGGTHIERELTVTENLLPDGLKVERADLISRAQSEWHFIVLSTKLHENYKSELADLKDKVGQMTEYSGEVWDSLKGFWNKVQEQVRDRNLFREHADVLRDSTNVLFDDLKNMRSTLSNEFEDNSKTLYARFNGILDEIEKKVETGIQRFPNIFDDLKKTQADFRGQKLTRDHSNEIWNRIDNMFKVVKEKKFGNNAINDTSATERLARRYEGLLGAMHKMQDSIDRDREELDFQTNRVNNSVGQLEAQIRQAKINMVLDRVKSKEEKLNEMVETKIDIESKMNNLKEKEARKAIVNETTKTERLVTAPQVEKVVVNETPSVAEPKIAETHTVVEAIAAPAVSEVTETISVVETNPTVVVSEVAETVIETVSTPSVATAVDPEMADIAANAHAAIEATENAVV
jgi:TolA-binding protein